MRGGAGAGVYGQSVRRSLSLSLGIYATVFQAEVFAILACVYDIKAYGTPEKHLSICSDSLAVLKALGAVRTTSPLVRQCQEALNSISARHAVGLYWVPGYVGVRGNQTSDGLARNGSASGFVGPEPAWGSPGRIVGTRLVTGWETRTGVAGTQRQARELISGPCRGTRFRFLSFNTVQSRVVAGLLTGHNTLRRHLHGQPPVQEMWSGGWNLCPHSLSVWGFGLS
jgi:ribonuclease HI